MDKQTASVKLTTLTISTDGTGKNTSIKLNGSDIANLSSFSFSYYPSSYSQGVGCSFVVRDPNTKPGEFSTYTEYYFRPVPVDGQYASDEKQTASDKTIVGEVVQGRTMNYDPNEPKDLRAQYAKSFGCR